MKKLVVNPGDRFGFLTVICETEKYVLPSGQKVRKFLFRCECGNEKVIFFDNVKRGKVVSCGCYLAKRIVEANITHGLTGTYEYMTWVNVLNRCNDPKNKSYADYGGRGIECRLESVTDIIDSIGFRPTPNHSIDRIDNSKHYEKGNIRWATRKEQNNNTRKNVFIEHNGIRLTHAQWGDRLGVNHKAIHLRIKNGWCNECTITLPFDKNRSRCIHK